MKVSEEDTVINEAEGVTNKKEKSSRTGRPKKAIFDAPELQEKINLIFGAIAKISGREYSFSDEDFAQEGKALGRMSDKFPIVGECIKLLDPVLIILGLITKFLSMPKKVKSENETEVIENETL